VTVSGDPGAYTLVVPGIPAMLSVAREFATAVCRGRGVDPEVVADLRLCVTEGLSLLISGDAPVTISIFAGPSAVSVEVEGRTPPPRGKDDEDGLVLGPALLRAIANEVTIAAAGDRTTISFSLPDPGD
jgi:hypothetical protein